MALTRITKGVIKPNENYDTHNIVSTGIVTSVGLDVNGNADVSGSLSVGGVLTYEDVTSIDSVGIITARTGLVSPYADIDDFVSVGSNIHLGNAGVVTATSFVGSGAALTGIDATAIKDSGGNVKVQAQASGAMYTGIHTFSSGAEVGSNIKLGNAGVITATSFVGSGAALTGIDATAVKDSGGNVKIQAQASGAVYTGIHTFGTNTNFTDIDVDGHTNLDNVNIAGVSTFAGTLNASTVSSTALIASGDLDVDGHTNLDNVSIAGVSTFTGNADFSSGIDVTGVINTTVAGGNNQLKIETTSSGDPSIYFAASGSGGHNIEYIRSSNTLNFKQAGGSVRLSITAAGHLLPGTDSQYNIGENGTRFANVYADTLYGDGSNLTGLSSDLVNDTSPQLGANLDTNTKCIDFGDSNTGTVNRLRFGASTDLEIFHNGTNNHIDCHTAGQDLYIRPTKDVYIQDYSTDDIHIKMIKDGAVELYHNNEKKLYTKANGVQVEDTTATGAYLTMATSSGTAGHLYATGNNTLGFLDGQNHYMLKGVKDGGIELYYDNYKNFEVIADGAAFDNDTNNMTIYLKANNDLKGYIFATAGDEIGFKTASNEWAVRIDSDAEVDLYYDGNSKLTTASGGVNVTGDLTASGFVDSSSDIKLKTNIKTIDNALDKVLQLRGAEYDRIDKGNQHEIGVIAQEVEKIIPEVVHGEETKTVSYGNIVAVLIEAIKEQNEVINKMKKEIEDLKG